MNAREEYEFYKDPRHLEPQGPPRRRRSGLSEMLPVRLSPELLEALRRRARQEERSVSWIARRAIQRHLHASEDVGWLLPEIVLDPVYRPVGERAEALKALHDFVGSRLGEVIEPEPGSHAAMECDREVGLAGRWGARPVSTVVFDAKQKLGHAMEHLDGLRRLVSPPIRFFSAAAVARATVEASARAWWLLEPAVDERTRLARGMTERLASLWSQRAVATSLTRASIEDREDAVREVDVHIDAILSSASELGFEVVQKKRGPAVIGEPRPTSTDLVGNLFARYVPGAESVTYRLWSAIIHATGWEAELFAEVEPGPVAGYETQRLVPRPEHVRILLQFAALACMEAADRFFRYFGGPDLEDWERTRRRVGESIVESLR